MYGDDSIIVRLSEFPVNSNSSCSSCTQCLRAIIRSIVVVMILGVVAHVCDAIASLGPAGTPPVAGRATAGRACINRAERARISARQGIVSE
jgi:hypothetical protein